MKRNYKLLLLLPLLLLFLNFDDCEGTSSGGPTSSSGVKQATTKVEAGIDGLTVEQRNISKRLAEDNKPGAIKHLYVISPYSGQVLIYSTIRGKVTSGGKRLTPTTVATSNPNVAAHDGVEVDINGVAYRTSEVLQDDGTYGQSGDYLYWWDAQGRYHQHYLTGGQIIHISDQPMPVKSIVINMEQNKGE